MTSPRVVKNQRFEEFFSVYVNNGIEKIARYSLKVIDIATVNLISNCAYCI